MFCASCASLPVEQKAASITGIEPQWRTFDDGVQFAHISIAQPRLAISALRIDLGSPRIEVVMNEGGDFSGVIPSIKVSSFLREYDCIAALNAGPFEPVSAKEGEARKITGLFVSDGIIVSPPAPQYAALVFFKDGSGAVLNQQDAVKRRDMVNAAGGFSMILDGGIIPAALAGRTARHPRSAAGFSADGMTLYLLAIDGRRPGSIGATESETAAILRTLGAVSGINLDGGGSTAMALRYNGKAVLANKPAHQPFFGAERAVATCIGVRLRSE